MQAFSKPFYTKGLQNVQKGLQNVQKGLQNVPLKNDFLPKFPKGGSKKILWIRVLVLSAIYAMKKKNSE